MRRFFCILILSLFVSQSIGQTKINLESFNYDLLESLVLKKVNVLRKQKRAPQLKANKILAVSAQNHSDYQARKNKMTHNQTGRDTKYVWLRVQKEGGNFSSISENVAYTDVFGIHLVKNKGRKIKIEASTYEGLAEILFLGWKNSKPHYKAMINKSFNLTGLKFKLNPKTKRLYATQVFAKK